MKRRKLCLEWGAKTGLGIVAAVASLVITMSIPEWPLFEDFTYIAANS